jgi:ABC-type dipeptide/oligopeptide/nickel transport system permease component
MRFIIKRSFITLLTLVLVSLLTFAAFRLIPGDAAIAALGTEASEEQLADLRAELGLDKSLLEQYVSWLGKFITGRLGSSARFRGVSISGMIAERLPVTGSLALLALCFILLIGIPFSFISTAKEDSPAGRIINTFTAITISMPGFFLGVLLIWVFGIIFKLFIPGLYIDYREHFGAFIQSLVFPALAIALPNAALLIKFLRTSILKEREADYARTARSKGLSSRQVLFKHVIKNASLPALTMLGMIIGEIFSGSIVIESVFGIPGLGRLLIASISSRDYPMTETLMVYIAFVVILGNMLADISTRIIDPRIADEKVRGE